MYAELERTCKDCGISKSISLFTSSGNSASARSRAKNFCHECQKKVGKERMKIFRNKYPEKIRDSKLKSVYGLTLAEYEEKSKKQNGVCEICKTKSNRKNGVTGKPENLVVDHDHKTGLVRDLLCHKCNMEVGIIENNLPRLLNYLNKFKK